MQQKAQKASQPSLREIYPPKRAIAVCYSSVQTFTCGRTRADRQVRVLDFTDRLIPYQEVDPLQHAANVYFDRCQNGCEKQQSHHYLQAWDLQKRLVVEAVQGSDQEEAPSGFLIILQHAPVYTLGPGSSLEHLSFDPAEPPFPLFRTERGGEVTYHGPGQLVAYPVINLRRYQTDLHWYLRSLEEIIIRSGHLSSIMCF